MIFASFEFLFLFLPIFFCGYFLTPEKYRNYAILAFSWGFYAWWRVDFLGLLVTMTTFTYFVARLMERAGRNTVRERQWMLFGIIGNLSALGYFKYANFVVGNVNAVKTAFGFHPMAWDNIILPIGLSFYILQSVSYLLDIRSGTVPVSRSYLNYAAYKAIFSQLIAGPIVRYAEIAPELKARHHSLRQFGIGGRIFAIRPGDALPRIGRVNTITRRGDRWVVTGPGGAVVLSMEASNGEPLAPRGPSFARGMIFDGQ